LEVVGFGILGCEGGKLEGNWDGDVGFQVDQVSKRWYLGFLFF